MKNKELKVYDETVLDEFQDHESYKVIIHDLVGGQPSVVEYDFNLVANSKDLENIIQNNGIEYYEEDIKEYIVSFVLRLDVTDYEEEIGIHIERYTDYLKRTNPTITPNPPVPGWQVHTFQESMESTETQKN